MAVICPGCQSEIRYHPPIKLNQQFTCETCGMELEVIWLYPLEFAKNKPAPANPANKPVKKVSSNKTRS